MICSFCKKHQNEVAVLVVGPDVSICDECLFICFDVVKEHFYSTEKVVKAHENTIKLMEIGG
ncbi:MAG: hypothetical protein FVQ80_06905 [Planctomycetes bacterium]|nr:hypothetical protein [Planctomycetota bacterium]